MPTDDVTAEPAVEGAVGGVPGVGDVVAGKYRIEQVLGRGGMGVVLLATHEQLEDRVALKVLLPEVARDQDVVQRFTHEARAAKSLRSEHVVRVLDIGALPGGTPFMVMEFLEGEDLNTRLERGGVLPVSEAVDHVLQAMVALAEAHASGLIHRDLKPANLFLSQRPDGAPLVKVLDFGISKRHQPNLIGGSELAQTQRLMGSPLYMSPEQLRTARRVDARTDIWALGVTLFELIAGRCPFEAESMSAVMIAIANDPPATFSQLGVPVPEGLEEVVLRCLEKDQERRWGSVAELAQALAPYAGREGQRAAESVLGVTLRASYTSVRPPPMAMLTPVPVGGSVRPPAVTLDAAATTGRGTVRPPSWIEPTPTTTTLAESLPAPAPASVSRPVGLRVAAVSLVALGAAGFWLARTPASTTNVTSASPRATASEAPATSAAPTVAVTAATATSAPAIAVAAAVSASASPAVREAPARRVAREAAPVREAPTAVREPAPPPDINDLIENRR